MNQLNELLHTGSGLKDSEVIGNVIELFLPKINKSLMQTNLKEREDLSQDLKLRLIDKMKNYRFSELPGFFEFRESIRKTS